MNTDVHEEWDILEVQGRDQDAWDESGFEGGEDQAIELEDTDDDEGEEEEDFEADAAEEPPLDPHDPDERMPLEEIPRIASGTDRSSGSKERISMEEGLRRMVDSGKRDGFIT
ncbi:MAG: hypothetical protein ACO4BJ_14150, partial [Planctomycetota bacterium]